MLREKDLLLWSITLGAVWSTLISLFGYHSAEKPILVWGVLSAIGLSGLIYLWGETRIKGVFFHCLFVAIITGNTILASQGEQIGSLYYISVIIVCSGLASVSKLTTVASYGILAGLLSAIAATRGLEYSSDLRQTAKITLLALTLALLPITSSILYSEIRRLMKSIRNQERLSAAGRISASIAHEVRNPLTSLSGCFQLLKQELNLNDPSTQKMANIVEREIQRLANLTKEFLDYSKGFTIHKAPTDIAILLNDLATMLNSEENQKPIRVIGTEAGQNICHIDKSRITQVFLNLLRNARKVSAKEVLVKHTQEKHYTRVIIEDDGPGIAPERLDDLFEPFGVSKTGGSGLGLSISKTIIDLHQGSITGYNKPHSPGAVFEVILPKGDLV